VGHPSRGTAALTADSQQFNSKMGVG